jgi:hypothetical protein
VGENFNDVVAAIGEPTEMSTYQTDQSDSPLYIGGDSLRVAAHYKGVGVITFTYSTFNATRSVLEINYDPSDPG